MVVVDPQSEQTPHGETGQPSQEGAAPVDVQTPPTDAPTPKGDAATPTEPIVITPESAPKPSEVGHDLPPVDAGDADTADKKPGGKPRNRRRTIVTAAAAAVATGVIGVGTVAVATHHSAEPNGLETTAQGFNPNHPGQDPNLASTTTAPSTPSTVAGHEGPAVAGGEKSSNDPNKLSTGQRLSWSYQPTDEKGNLLKVVTPNSIAQDSANSADLADIFNNKAMPDVKNALVSGQVKVYHGASLADSTTYQDNAGATYKVRRYYLNPITDPSQNTDSIKSYFGVADAGRLRGTTTQTGTEGTVRSAFGYKDVSETFNNNAPPVTVNVDGALSSNNEGNPDFIKKFSGNLNVHWQKTGVVVTDPSTGETFVAGGIVNVVSKVGDQAEITQNDDGQVTAELNTLAAIAK